MQAQHSLRRTAAAAVLIVAFCVPPLHADGESPYQPPEARIGRPPGVYAESTATAPAPDASSSESTETSEARIRPGITEDSRSLWATFMTWLDEQLQRVTRR